MGGGGGLLLRGGGGPRGGGRRGGRGGGGAWGAGARGGGRGGGGRRRGEAWVGRAPSYEVVTRPDEGEYAPETVTVLDLASADPAACPVGVESAAGGRAAVEAVLRGADLAMAGEIDAVVTAPLNKAA